MFAFIRYTIYLITILFCLFLLQKMDVDVKGGFWNAANRVEMFFKSIGDAPDATENSIVKDILK